MLKSNFLNIVHMLNKKEIHVKDIFLLFLIVISLSFWVIYTSFAIFTNTLNKSNVASIILEVPNYKIESTSTLFDNQTKQIIIPANESIRFDVDITSTSMGNTKYKLYYEMVSPTSLPETLTVGVNSFSDNPRTANIAFNNTETKNVDIEVLNSGDSAVTLKFDVMGGYVNNEVVLPENKFELIEFSPTTSVTKKSNTNQITLKEATEGNLSGYQIFGNTEQRNLPTEYQEVEYIESTGTQYIDTNFVPSGSTSVEFEFSDIGNNGVWFGSYTNTSSWTDLSYGLYHNYNVTSGQFYIHYQSNTKVDYTPILGSGVIELRKGSLYINGNLIKETTISDFNSTQTMYFLNGHGSQTQNQPIAAKVYYFKLYDNDVLIRNMIPCYRKSDNVIGMYDVVNNVFYTNAGTGTFTKGGNITPTPTNPVSVVSLGEESKNLFDKDNVIVGYNIMNGLVNANVNYSISDYIEIIGGSTYTISQIQNYILPEGLTSSIGCASYDDNKNDMRSEFDLARSTTGKYIETITVPTNAKYIRCSMRNTDTEYQVEKNSTATPYKPYRYIDVVSSGKNLITSNTVDWQNGTFYAATGLYQTNAARIETLEKIKVVPNTTYTFKINSSDSPLVYQAVGFYKIDKSYIGYNNTNTGTKEATFTTPDNCEYIWIALKRADLGAVSVEEISNSDLQLELGTTATSYEPYKEQLTTIDLLGHEPLRKIGDVADYVDYKNNKIVRNVRKVVFNGSENWYTFGSNVALRGWDNALTPIHTYDRKLQGYKCNIATETTTMSLTENNNTFATHNVSTDSNDWIVFHINNTVDDWKVYLAEQYAKGTPVVVYHKLATPDDTETITLPQISTFSGTNIFRILNGGLNMTYTKNT